MHICNNILTKSSIINDSKKKKIILLNQWQTSSPTAHKYYTQKIKK